KHWTDPGDGRSVSRTFDSPRTDLNFKSGFDRFNTIITSLKALDEGFSSKNYVKIFLRDLHPKWRAKVKAIEESKDLSSLALDELISNLKVHKIVMEKDFEIYRGKKEKVKSIALKAKKESSNDETVTSERDDEEYAMACGDPNHLIGDCPKPSRNKDQMAFNGGSWSDSENDTKEKTNDATCLMAQSSNEKKEILELSEKIKKLENKEIEIACLGFDNSKACGTKIMSFVESSAENAMEGSTIMRDGYTLPRSVNRNNGKKGT
nr:hypothetical protein [Tanacetum cinerariifolium]